MLISDLLLGWLHEDGYLLGKSECRDCDGEEHDDLNQKAAAAAPRGA